jgi:hypothetical protein
MTQHNKKNGWQTDLNFDNMKEPLKDLSATLKSLKKDYEKKCKDIKRMRGVK